MHCNQEGDSEIETKIIDKHTWNTILDNIMFYVKQTLWTIVLQILAHSSPKDNILAEKLRELVRLCV